MNVVFLPMIIQGMEGVSRRLFDGGATYDFAQPVLHLNVVSSWGASMLALFQIPFIFNFFKSIWKGEQTDANPVAGHDAGMGGALAAAARQFHAAPKCTAARTGTAFPGAARDFQPQHAGREPMDIPYTDEVRPDTGLTNGKLGIWLFLASEVMLFGALFATYIMMRMGAEPWPQGASILNVPLATFNTVVLISSSVTMVMAWASLMRRRFGTFQIYMFATVGLGVVFLVVKYFELQRQVPP